MDNLAPPPYRSQDSTPQILDIRNHLQALLHRRVSFGSDLASGPRRRAPIQQPELRDFDNMKTESYLNEPQRLRGTVEIERHNEEAKLSVDAANYKIADPPASEYLSSHNSYFPYSINTIHLQNRYKQPEILEGYAPKRTLSKVGIVYSLFTEQLTFYD